MSRSMDTRCTTCGAEPFVSCKQDCPDYQASLVRLDPASIGLVFTHADWGRLLDATFAEMKKLAELKGGEYSGDTDRLLNFRRNGASLGLPMETVWAVYAGKHWDAIQQFIKDQREGKERVRLEGIEGRVDDLLVYLLLFKAMLIERRK